MAPSYQTSQSKSMMLQNQKKEEIEKEASNQIEETQEVKTVYDVKLLENDIEVQPDGTIKVRIPIPEGITNPKLLVKRSNGMYETVNAKEEDGYLVYETDELGTVTVIADKTKTPVEPEPTPDPEEPDPNPEPKDPVDDRPDRKEPILEPNHPTVQGAYTKGVQTDTKGTQVTIGMGGASTGDTSTLTCYLGCSFFALGILCLLLFKDQYRKKNN